VVENLGTFDMGDLDVPDSWQSDSEIQPWEGRKVLCGWSTSRRCWWPSLAEAENARQASRRVIAKCSDQERTATSLSFQIFTFSMDILLQ
jgi:hypothetical protein